MRSVKLWRDVDTLEEYQFTNAQFAEFLQQNIQLIRDGYRLYDGSCAKSKDITLDAKKVAKCKDVVILKPMHGFTPLEWAILAAAAISSAVAVIFMAPKIETPDGAVKQSSPTNRFGSRENEMYKGGRIDDVWGYVPYFTPRMIQTERTYFVDGNEVEEFAMAMMGEIEIDKGIVRDGETNFKNLTGGSFNKWNPGDDLTGEPSFKIGSSLAGPINKIKKSEELQPQELLPPNDLDLGEVDWRATATDNGDGTYNVVIEGTNLEDLGVSLTDYIQVGDNFTITDFVKSQNSGLQTLYYTSTGSQGPSLNSRQFQKVDIISLDGTYESSSVSSNSVSFTTDNQDWDGLSNFSPIASYWFTQNEYDPTFNNYVGFNTTDSSITERTYFSHNGLDYPPESVMTNSLTNLNASVGKVNSNIVGPIYPPEDADKLYFNIFSDAGFYKLVKNNEQKVEIEIEVIFEEIDDEQIPTGRGFTEKFDYSSHPTKVTRSTGFTYPTSAPSYSKYQVSLKRITDRDKSSNVQSLDKAYWGDLYYEESVSLPNNEDLSIMKARIPSSPASRGVKKRLVNFDAVRVFEPYIGNGNFGPKQPVRTFAETLIGIALDKYNGRLTLEQIDGDTLLEIQEQMKQYYGFDSYCDLGYNFDNSKVRFQEAYKLLCTAVNAQSYAQGGVFKAYPDINRTVSSKQFTHRYKLAGSDTRATVDYRENDGVIVSYRNEKGEEKIVERHVNGLNSYNPLKIQLSGCFQEKVATIRADRELNILKFQRDTFNFDSDALGLLAVPSERVDNVDLTRIADRPGAETSYKIYDGVVESVNGLTLQLSEPVYFEEGQTHSIRFTKKNGSVMPAIACVRGSSDYHVILQEAPESEILTGYLGEKTNFTFASDSNRASLPCIIRSIKSKKSKGLDARSLTCVNYDERYYQNDKQFSEI